MWFLLCYCWVPAPPACAQDERQHLSDLAESFAACSFDWQNVKKFGLLNKCLLPAQFSRATCGKILLHCTEAVTCFRQKIGIRICVFKVGVTSNPIKRYQGCMDLGFHAMWVIAVSPSIDLIHMLEAALVMEFHKHVGCRNKEGTGGEGALNRSERAPGPYYVYVTGGRADQRRRVGWQCILAIASGAKKRFRLIQARVLSISTQTDWPVFSWRFTAQYHVSQFLSLDFTPGTLRPAANMWCRSRSMRWIAIRVHPMRCGISLPLGRLMLKLVHGGCWFNMVTVPQSDFHGLIWVKKNSWKNSHGWSYPAGQSTCWTSMRYLVKWLGFQLFRRWKES